MPSATIEQCAILVGGRGTRLGAISAATPKPLLVRGGKPFLAWLIREMSRFGVTEFLLLTGHLSEVVEAAIPTIQAALPKRVKIEISREPTPAGTGGALFHAAGRLRDRFLMCNGDSLFDTNLAALLAASARDGAEVEGRISLRRLADASRSGVVTLDGDRVTSFAARPPPGTPGIINAGIYLFDRRVLDRVRPDCSLEADIMPGMARDGVLRGTLGTGYFRDIGVPDDYGRADREMQSIRGRKALFLDRDGVTNIDHGYVGTRERFEWVAGATEAIRHATETGWHVFLVTNQSGVARGHYPEASVSELTAWMAEEVRRAGGTIDDLRYAPFHADAAGPTFRARSDWRKPAPGMLLDLMRAWELDPARCVMIGDQTTDLQTAAAAGISGHRFSGGNLKTFLAPILDRMAT